MKLKHICISIGILMLSNFSYAQLSLNTVKAKEQFETCTGLQQSYLAGKRLNKNEVDIISPAINRECLLTEWNNEVNLKNIDFQKPFDEAMKNNILAVIPQLSVSNLTEISGNLFENLFKTYKENKASIPEKEKLMAREVSLALKKRIYQINIPKEYMKIPQPQRNIALIPFLSSFKKSKSNFQQLDAILYPYQMSLDMINKVEKTINDDEKTKLVLTPEECEVAQTYLDNAKIISCKK